MTWEKRKVYVNAHVATNEKGVKTVGDTSRRNKSFIFFLRKDEVCNKVLISEERVL